MLPTKILYHGYPDPLPAQIDLRAGPLRLVFENGDLRAVRLGEVEILRRVYVAIRDRNWGTVAPVFSNLHIDARPDSFEISFDVDNRQGEIDFAWRARFSGDSAGRLSLSMDGAARSTFQRNRIGFCVLLPAACAGQPCQVQHLDGSLEAGYLPGEIDASQPVLPFTAMRRLVYGRQANNRAVGPGLQAEIVFGGEAFEMEDQRNWTDASFKIYSTPLALPFPVEVQAGTRISQTLTLALRLPPAVQSAAGARPSTAQPEQVVTIALDDDALPASRLPQIGLGMASHGAPLSAVEIERLTALRLHHLRADLLLSDPAYPLHLQRAAQEAATLGVGLELAVFVSEDMENELAALHARLEAARPPLVSLLIYPRHERYQGGSVTAAVVRAARAHLAVSVPLGAGTNSDFIFLKRTPPPVDRIDFLTVALNPQVHAFDNTSLIETLEAQPVSIASARRLAQGKPVYASPITLKPRFNPYATGAGPLLPPGALPTQVDPRQMSLFAAGWTLGSLRAMLLGGAASVTYYETTGWRGVMETEAGSPLPAFPSLPGMVFPLYHVLAALADFAPAAGLSAGAQPASGQPLLSSQPMLASAILLRAGARARLLLASHSQHAQQICLTGLPGAAHLRLLDETSAVAALHTPQVFWAQPAAQLASRDGQLCLTLLPYAFASLDL